MRRHVGRMLLAMALCGSLALAPARRSSDREPIEIFVVSCPQVWIDLHGAPQVKPHEPDAAYTLENDAEIHVRRHPACDYTHVLLRP